MHGHFPWKELLICFFPRCSREIGGRRTRLWQRVTIIDIISAVIEDGVKRVVYSARVMPFNTASSSARLMCLSCVFNDGSVIFNSHPGGQGAGIHPHSDFLTIRAPVTVCWISLWQSHHNFVKHPTQHGVSCFVVPSGCHSVSSSFHKRSCNTEPAAHWKMPGQPPTHRKDGTTREYIGDLWTLAVASPSKLAALLLDVYAQHSSATT